MQTLIVLSAVEQVAGHLRRELRRGVWHGTMPGVKVLVAELGVNHKTVEAALRMLEAEGLLVNQGRGLQRRIVPQSDHAPPGHRGDELASPELMARWNIPPMITLCCLL